MCLFPHRKIGLDSGDTEVFVVYIRSLLVPLGLDSNHQASVEPNARRPMIEGPMSAVPSPAVASPRPA